MIMKALKLFILLGAFAFANQASAQFITVDNTTSLSGEVLFEYSHSSCGTKVINFTPSSNTTIVGCPPNTLVQVTITFEDASCSPPVTQTITLTLASAFQTYVACDGTHYQLALFDIGGGEYQVAIN